MGRAIAAAVLVTFLAAGSVAAVAVPTPTPPSLRSAGHAWDPESAERPLVTALVFVNPNPFPVRVTAIHYDIRDGDTLIAEGLAAPRVYVDAESAGTVVLRTRPMAGDPGDDAGRYGVEGVALVTGFGVPMPVPFAEGPGGDGDVVPVPGLGTAGGEPSHKNS